MIEKLETDQLNIHRKLGAESVDILTAFEKINEIIDVVNILKESNKSIRERQDAAIPPDINNTCRVCGQLKYNHQGAHNFV